MPKRRILMPDGKAMSDERDSARPDATPEALTPRQVKALETLVAGGTASDAADAAGVSRSQVWRWQKAPAFEATLNRARRSLHEANAARLLTLVDMSLDVVA